MGKWLVALQACVLFAWTAAAGAPSVEGYWVSDTRLERPAGDVILLRQDGKWTASFNGEAATPSLRRQGHDETLEANFAGGVASLRARIAPNGKLLGAFWIQDGDQGQKLASPLALAEAAPGRWTAKVPTVDLRFTLFARIFRRDDKVLIVAFRNPQRNTRGGGSRLFVEQDGTTVKFLENNEGKPGIVHVAKLSAAGDEISMPWPEVGMDVKLKRVAEAPAGFLPRQGTAAYSYAAPAQKPDGWTTAAADTVGFDTNALQAAVQQIINTDPSERRPNLVHSLLVARKGRLVLEEYFYGADAAAIHDLRSAGKTFSNVMLGAVIGRGQVKSEVETLVPILSPAMTLANPSAQKERITLAHLMTHTSGLACDDSNQDSPGNEDTLQSQPEANWWAYAAGLPMVAEPGKRYAYCSAGMNLVGAALTLRSGQWLPELFHDTIARPLQFGTYAWNLMPTGEGYMGGGARLLSRDLLKLGQLYLGKGAWNGKRIVSPEWVERSTTPHVVINEASTGLDTETLQNTYPGGADGYAWHIFQIDVDGRKYTSYEASGNGGQMVVVVPELDLAVAMTGGNYNQGFIWGRWRDEIIGKQIIRALKTP
jgi:CubicO group peptidase (beta-lactamase class C family)